MAPSNAIQQGKKKKNLDPHTTADDPSSNGPTMLGDDHSLDDNEDDDKDGCLDPRTVPYIRIR